MFQARSQRLCAEKERSISVLFPLRQYKPSFEAPKRELHNTELVTQNKETGHSPALRCPGFPLLSSNNGIHFLLWFQQSTETDPEKKIDTKDLIVSIMTIR